MKRLDNYITEKLHIGKNIKPIEVDKDRPPVDSKVLMVKTTKWTKNDDYVSFYVYEIADYDEDKVILRIPDTNEVIDAEPVLTPDNKKRLPQTRNWFHDYFAEYRSLGIRVSFARLYDLDHGLEVLKNVKAQVNRNLTYVYGGFKFNFRGDASKKIDKLNEIEAELKS